MNFTAVFAGLRRWLESRSVEHKNLTIILRFGSRSAASAFGAALGNEFDNFPVEREVLRMQVDGLEVRVEGPSN